MEARPYIPELRSAEFDYMFQAEYQSPDDSRSEDSQDIDASIAHLPEETRKQKYKNDQPWINHAPKYRSKEVSSYSELIGRLPNSHAR